MRYDQIIIISLLTAMSVPMLGFSLFLRIQKLSMGGVPPIGAFFFKTAKAAMMLT